MNKKLIKLMAMMVVMTMVSAVPAAAVSESTAEDTTEIAETAGAETEEAAEEEAEATEASAEVTESGEESGAEPAADLHAEIEDGCYVIRIPVESDDQGWIADEQSEGEAVVELEKEETTDGMHIIRYKPVADGTGTVAVRHFGTVVCDQIHTFDLKVEGGKVTESTGGSYTASPADEELDPYILGEWEEPEKQLDLMTITKNEEEGWDVEIVSASGAEPFVFLGTVFYDCERDEFIYPYGEFYKTEITAEEEAPDLGEPFVSGASGALRFEGTEEDLKLGWYSWLEEQDPEPVVFARVKE